jgi:hypothetical protein
MSVQRKLIKMNNLDVTIFVWTPLIVYVQSHQALDDLSLLAFVVVTIDIEAQKIDYLSVISVRY